VVLVVVQNLIILVANMVKPTELDSRRNLDKSADSETVALLLYRLY